MRIHLFRGMLALAVVLAVSAPATAQSIVRGKVVDAQGKPVEGAKVAIEGQGIARRADTTTNRNGEFLQVGLASGRYNVTVSKEGVGTLTLPANITQGRPTELNFQLTPVSGLSQAEKEALAAMGKLATEAQDAMRSGRDDDAIKAFSEIIVKVPNCGECYFNLGTLHTKKQQYTEAEAAYKKAIEIDPNNGDAYTGLANIYNAQKKFDLAADASSKASQLSSAAGGGGNAEALYNQGVILFNGQKFAESKVQFEASVKADPNFAPAYYQLGMAALNLGQIPDAVAALEKYLEIAPDGPKAGEVKAALPALQAMVKK
jgi:tetratricopeptide (TPR) repeat protein